MNAAQNIASVLVIEPDQAFDVNLQRTPPEDLVVVVVVCRRCRHALIRVVIVLPYVLYEYGGSRAVWMLLLVVWMFRLGLCF